MGRSGYNEECILKCRCPFACFSDRRPKAHMGQCDLLPRSCLPGSVEIFMFFSDFDIVFGFDLTLSNYLGAYRKYGLFEIEKTKTMHYGVNQFLFFGSNNFCIGTQFNIKLNSFDKYALYDFSFISGVKLNIFDKNLKTDISLMAGIRNTEWNLIATDPAVTIAYPWREKDMDIQLKIWIYKNSKFIYGFSVSYDLNFNLSHLYDQYLELSYGESYMTNRPFHEITLSFLIGGDLRFSLAPAPR